MIDEQDCNGWATRDTWNVAMWIQNNESLYDLARRCARRGENYHHLTKYLRAAEIRQTPDGTLFLPEENVTLNVPQLNDMMRELADS